MDAATIRRKFKGLSSALDERSRRLWVATEARAIGHGGIALVAEATGVSRSTISRGLRELDAGEVIEEGRVRRAGAGRKKVEENDVTLLADLDALLDMSVSGDPQSPLRWTSKSVRKLAEQLTSMGHEISHTTVAELLHAAGYSLQANRKAKEGRSHPDRNAQFEYINRRVKAHQRRGQPVISVDTKKKELVGDFRNAGREWRPEGHPERVKVHDFKIPELGKAIPYGVYDLTRNAGWVSVGIDHDTASFAVQSIRRWWQTMGRGTYPKATSLLITADGGGSNGSSNRLWKWELQKFANSVNLNVNVCHFPPGTSKWNKIEHRMFSYITMNWRGRPLTSLAVIVSLIAGTRTQQGLRIRCELDERSYPRGREVTPAQLASVDLRPDAFHGEWNYAIRRRAKSSRE